MREILNPLTPIDMSRVTEIRNTAGVVVWNEASGINFLPFMKFIFKWNGEEVRSLFNEVGSLSPLTTDSEAYEYLINHCELTYTTV
jgi:hypothetical protein